MGVTKLSILLMVISPYLQNRRQLKIAEKYNLNVSKKQESRTPPETIFNLVFLKI